MAHFFGLFYQLIILKKYLPKIHINCMSFSHFCHHYHHNHHCSHHYHQWNFFGHMRKTSFLMYEKKRTKLPKLGDEGFRWFGQSPKINVFSSSKDAFLYRWFNSTTIAPNTQGCDISKVYMKRMPPKPLIQDTSQLREMQWDSAPATVTITE